MDIQALLYGPAHLLLGVDAKLVVGGADYPVRAIDKTTGVDTGVSVHGQTILPAAILQVRELTKLGIDVKELGSSKTFISLNGTWWSVVTYRMRPTPNGEADGEVLLVLDKNGAPSQAPSSVGNRALDLQSLLFSPAQAAFGTPVKLVLSGVEYNLSGIDKTSGIDIGETIKGQTVLPACILRAQEFLALGLQYSALGTRRSYAKVNNNWWSIVTFRMRPGLYGEDDGEIYLLLSALAVPPIPTSFDVAVLFSDAAFLLANLQITHLLSASLTDDGGCDARIGTGLSAILFDDGALSAAIGTDLSAAISDDGGIDPVIGTDLSAIIADDGGISSTIGTDLSAVIADDGGFIPDWGFFLGPVVIADDAGLAANLYEYYPPVVIADAGGISALITTDLSAIIADDGGISAVPGTDLVAIISDAGGLSALLTTDLVAAFTDAAALSAVLCSDLAATIADDGGISVILGTGLVATLSDDNGIFAAYLGTVDLLSSLGDVTITSLANGQILKYDASSGKWKNITEVIGLAAVISDDSSFSASLYQYAVAPIVGLYASLSDDGGFSASLYQYAVAPIVGLYASLSDDGGLNASLYQYTYNPIVGLYASLSDDSSLSATLIDVIAGLGDAVITSPTDGQTLRYDAASGKWKNVSPVGSVALPTPGGTLVTSFYRYGDSSSISGWGRQAAISSVATDTITLTTAVADQFFSNSNMLGLSYVRIWNVSKTPNQSAWVKAQPSTTTLQVRTAADISTWANGETIQIGDPISVTPGNVVAVDISQMQTLIFGAPFQQTAILAKGAIIGGTAGDTINISGNGVSGSLNPGARGAVVGVLAGDGSVFSPCSVLSPISNSNLVFINENVATTAGVRLLSSVALFQSSSGVTGSTGGSSTLAGDTDVSLSSLANNNILQYDIATGKWKNKQPPYALIGADGMNTHVSNTIASVIYAGVSHLLPPNFVITHVCYYAVTASGAIHTTPVIYSLNVDGTLNTMVASGSTVVGSAGGVNELPLTTPYLVGSTAALAIGMNLTNVAGGLFPAVRTLQSFFFIISADTPLTTPNTVTYGSNSWASFFVKGYHVS